MQNRKKYSLNEFLASFFLMLYFAELVFPRLNAIFDMSIVCFISLMAWLFFAYTINVNFFSKNKTIVLLAIYFALILGGYIWGYPIIAHRYMNMGLVICGPIIYEFYKTTGRLYQLKRILLITFALASMTLVTTLSALLVNAYVSRSIKSSGEHSALLAKQGIGGYSFIYFVAALMILILYYVLKTNSLRKRVLASIVYLICMFFVIKSNYMTAFVIAVVCSGILIFVHSTKRKNGIVFGVIFFICFIVICFSLNDLLDMLAPILPSRIADVLIDTENKSVLQSISDEFFGDRWPFMFESIESFLKYPFLGLIGTDKLVYVGEHLSGFGQHSFILDSFALYGFLGGILVLIAIVYPFKKMYNNEKAKPLTVSVMVCMLMIYFFNNATESIALVITIMYPYTRDTLNNVRVN